MRLILPNISRYVRGDEEKVREAIQVIYLVGHFVHNYKVGLFVRAFSALGKRVLKVGRYVAIKQVPVHTGTIVRARCTQHTQHTKQYKKADRPQKHFYKRE